MVDKRKIRWLYLALLWVLISISAWPAYVLCSTLLAAHGAEGWQLDAWNQAPRSQIVEHFLFGYKASAIVAIPLGLIAVVDYLLFSTYKATWLVAGILLPTTAVIIAFTLYQNSEAALPSLVATGLLLVVIHRLLDIVAGRESRGRIR